MEDPAAALEAWVRTFIIALDLCPFAAAPLTSGRVRFCSADCPTVDEAIAACATELARLIETPAEELSTTLVALPGWSDFDEFLGLVGGLEHFLEVAGVEELVQVVAFHPDWVAADEDPEDPACATNRSPVPAVHLLRQEEVTRATRGHPDPTGIPRRNAALLRTRAQKK
jgi:hypothetical protein